MMMSRIKKGGAFGRFPQTLLGDYTNFSSNWETIYVSGHGEIYGGKMFTVPQNTYIINLAPSGRSCLKRNLDIEKYIFEKPSSAGAGVGAGDVLKELYTALYNGEFLKTPGVNTSTTMYKGTEKNNSSLYSKEPEKYKTETKNNSQLKAMETAFFARLRDYLVYIKKQNTKQNAKKLLDEAIDFLKDAQFRTYVQGTLQAALKYNLGTEQAQFAQFILPIIKSYSPALNKHIPVEEATLAIYEPGDLMFDTGIEFKNPHWVMMMLGAYQVPVPYEIRQALFDENKKYIPAAIRNQVTPETFRDFDFNYRLIPEGKNDPSKSLKANGTFESLNEKVFNVDANLLKDKIFSQQNKILQLSDIIQKINSRDSSKKRIYIVSACRPSLDFTKSKLARRMSVSARTSSTRKSFNLALLREYYDTVKAEYNKREQEKVSFKAGEGMNLPWSNMNVNSKESKISKSIKTSLEYIKRILDGSSYTLDELRANLEVLNGLVRIETVFGDELRKLMLLTKSPKNISARVKNTSEGFLSGFKSGFLTSKTKKAKPKLQSTQVTSTQNNSTGAGAGSQKKTTE